MIKASKRALAAAGIIGLVAAGAPRPASAAFVSISKATTTAVINFTGTGVVQMSILVKNFSDNANAANLTFNNVTLPVSGSGWVKSAQYIQLASTLTAVTGGIQIYTDNTAADAPIKYTGTSTTTAAGLVGAFDTTKTLLTAWTARDLLSGAVAPATDATGIVAMDPNSESPFQGWHFFIDQMGLSQSGFVNPPNNFQKFLTVKDVNGLHFGPGPVDEGAAVSPDYIVMEANFSSAVATNYAANIRLEAFTL